MAKSRLRFICPFCGHLAVIDRFYMDHKFPKLKRQWFLGGTFKYEEEEDPELVQELVAIFDEKLKKIKEILKEEYCE